jgi:hypothetical protein
MSAISSLISAARMHGRAGNETQRERRVGRVRQKRRDEEEQNLEEEG